MTYKRAVLLMSLLAFGGGLFYGCRLGKSLIEENKKEFEGRYDGLDSED